MTSKIIFKKIKFNNITSKNFKICIKKKGLFVFPAGPALALIEQSNEDYCIIEFKGKYLGIIGINFLLRKNHEFFKY